MHPIPPFTQVAVYSLWQNITSKAWKQADDEVTLAKILLEEARQPNKDRPILYTVKPIPITLEYGVTAIAFTLPHFLQQYGGQIRELALDSTCKFKLEQIGCHTHSFKVNTNGSRYEVFALLGEVYGAGMPLGYILIKTNDSVSNAKQHCIQQLLHHVKTTWKLRPIVTLTDKDWQEINAFLAQFPEVKHQLCFWHCLRTVKTHLSILQQTPAFYNVMDAMSKFRFIQESFVPIGQRKSTVSILLAFIDGQYSSNSNF